MWYSGYIHVLRVYIMYVCIHVATRWGYEQWHSQVTDNAWALLTFVLGCERVCV